MPGGKEVVEALFKRVTDKAFKLKKFDKEEFEEKVVRCGIQASVRYAWLGLTGPVTVRWDEGSGVLKVGGKYGKS